MTTNKNKIAIIGISGKFPESADLEEFGDNLENGRDSIRPIGQTRKIYSCLDHKANYFPIGHLDRVDLFDHAFFDISKMDAELMHPEQRLLLELSLEAIENAGYALSDVRGSNTMIYVGGNNKLDYAALTQSSEAANFTGNLSSMIAGRIAYMLDLQGGAMTVDTSCSSSLVAVHEVCRKIIYDDADMALAGGINLITSFPIHDVSVDSLGICSPDGKSKTFDASANGTGMGEGGGMLLLKRLDKALEDGDQVQAVILGSAINSDGGSSNGLTAPSPVAQKAVIQKALKAANVTADTISYVEAHGTGTKLGDPIEFTALNEVFTEAGASKGSCALSTVKTNLGHLGNGAGIAGVLKCVLSLKRKKLFPSLHYHAPNPFIDFNNSPLYVNTVAKQWEAAGSVRRCGVSSFGLTGTNAHLILEEAPLPQPNIINSEKYHFLKVSARSVAALKAYLRKIASFLDKGKIELSHALYTLNSGRDDHEYRIAIHAATEEDLKDGLLAKANEIDEGLPPLKTTKREVVILLSDEIKEVEKLHSRLSDFPPYSQFYADIFRHMESEAIGAPLMTFAVQLAMFRLWETWGIRAKTVIATGIGRIAKQVIFEEISLTEAIAKIAKGDLNFPPTNIDKLREVVMSLDPAKIFFLEMGFRGALSHHMGQWKELSQFQGLLCGEFGDANTFEHPLAILKRLYENGAEIDWNKYYYGKDYLKVSVPTYPFERVRCWPAPPLEVLPPEPEAWTYRLGWRETELPRRKQSVEGKKYLIFMDEEGLGDQLIAVLSSEKSQYIKVVSGSGYKKENESHYFIAPGEESDYMRLFEELEKSFIPEVIVHLNNVKPVEDENGEQLLERGLYSQFFVSKAILRWLDKQSLRFVTVSLYARELKTDPSRQVPEYATSYGLLAGLSAEYSQLSAACIDLGSYELSLRNIGDLLYDEINYEAGMLSVCYRDGKRYSPEIEKISLRETHDPVRPDGVYVVAGGAGGIGMEIVKDLVKVPRVSIIVIGRTGLPPESDWPAIATDKDADYHVTVKAFQDLRSQGADLQYYSADIADLSALQQCAEKIIREKGQVNGVIHLAGVPEEKKLVNQSFIDFKNTLLPKIHGTRNLFEVFAQNSDLFVMFSSLAAIRGYERGAAYGAANLFQDCFARKMTSQNTQILSINWPGWRETGMLRQAIDPETMDNAQWLDTEEGLAAFWHSLKGQESNVIISGVNPKEEGVNPYVLFHEDLSDQSDLPPGRITDEPIQHEHNSFAGDIQSEGDLRDVLRSIWHRILKNDDISDEDDFFDIGGHSINGMQMINLIRQELQVELEMEDLYDYATINEQYNYLKDALMVPSGISTKEESLSPVKQKKYTASHGQKRLWLMSQLETGSVAYNEPGAYVIHEAIDKAAVESALQALIIRHESLRTVFDQEGEEVVQIIKEADQSGFRLQYSDLRNEVDAEKMAQKLAYEATVLPFDLLKGPLFRASLMQLEDKKFLFVFIMHHIISDRWSVMLLTREFMMLYQAFRHNQPNPLTQLRSQYKDYVLWQQEQLSGENGQQAKAYWMRQFAGQIPQLELPIDFPRPAHRSFKGDSISTQIIGELKNSVCSMAKKEGVSLYMFTLATVTALLYKHTRQADIVLGSPVSGRLQKDFESQIGIFINILAMRIKFSPEQSFSELLREVKKVVLGALKHQVYPYDLLLEDLGLGLDRSRASSLFDVGIDFFSLNEEVENVPDILETSGFDTGFRSNTFDLRFRFIEYEHSLSLTIDYNTDLFAKERIQRFLAQYHRLVEGIVSENDKTLEELEFIPEQERAELLQLGNSLGNTERKVTDVLRLFALQVKTRPDAVAVTYEGKSLTFETLDHQASHFAACLIKIPGFKAGDMIGVCIDRSVNVLISILGIFKAGGVYLPIERRQPEKRIGFVLNDSDAKVLVLDRADDLDLQFSGSILAIDDLNFDHMGEASPESASLLPSDSAYVIYTSGSTGMPKGCVIEHQSLAVRIDYFINYLGIDPGSKVLQLASYGFDASLFEMFISLLAGAELVLAGNEEKENIDSLLTLIEAEEVTMATFPPAVLNIIGRRKLPTLKIIVSTGEAAILEDGLFHAGYLKFYNGYGPTETCIGATFYQLDLQKKDYYQKTKSLPIGRPFAETEILILNENMEIVPRGNTGGVYIAGTGISSGYLNKPYLTEEKFLNNPYSTGANEVLYRSGDLGRWNDHGDLEYIGREDNQVQINGVRVELEEITKTILTNPGIAKAAVILKDDQTLATFVERKTGIELWPDVNTVNVFDQVLYHSMGEDQIRIDAFRKAFENNLKNKTVIDVGTGQNALLAILAARAGAKKVYAIEINQNASQKAVEKIKEQGLEDVIEVINSDIRSIVLPEQVDFCVFDISGNIGGSGGATVLINHAKKFLKSPQSVLPKRYLTKVAGISLPEDNLTLAFSEVPGAYVKKMFEKQGYPFDLRLCLKYFPLDLMITSHEVFEDLDFERTVSESQTHDVCLTFEKDSVFHGLLLSLDVTIDHGDIISNLTEGDVILPVFIPLFWPGISVGKGDKILINISRNTSDNGVHPDYFVEGVLKTSAGNHAFDYQAYNHGRVFRGHAFYERLFKDGEIKIKPEFTEDNLRDYLSERLPQHMVPHHIRIREQLPLTVNGKIDTGKLTSEIARKKHEEVSELSPQEVKLIKIWENVLGKDAVHVMDNFFEIGGHSIKATQLVSRIQKSFGVKCDLKTVFERPTVRQMSMMIDERSVSNQDPITPVGEKPLHELSHSQKRIWALSQLTEASLSYHILSPFMMEGTLDSEVFMKAFDKLVDRHESLRTVFRVKDGEPFQKIISRVPLSHYFEQEDYSGTDRSWEALDEIIESELIHPFDLEEGPLFRVKLFRMGVGKHVLVFTIHHIIFDAWSMEVLIKEFSLLYDSCLKGVPAGLTPLTIQYKDFAAWQNQQLSKPGINQSQAYWEEKFQTRPPALILPYDKPRPQRPTFQGGCVQARMEQEVIDRLSTLVVAEGGTLFMGLQTLVKIFLYKQSGQSDLTIGTPVTGRHHVDLENQIGFYLNTLALRNSISEDNSFIDVLKDVVDSTLEGFQHQDYPFDSLVENLDWPRLPGRSALFDVHIVYQNGDYQAQEDTEVSKLRIKRFLGVRNLCKFDLEFIFTNSENGLILDLYYSSDLFEHSTIELMAERFRFLTKSLLHDVFSPLKCVDFAVDAESGLLKPDIEVDFDF